jgi:XRE family aerobic/anaerobic benzoate catabolism transcriptional regulator
VPPSDTDFLVAVGRRVREMREGRGMARKILARSAGMSERYLAQLEGGEGNSSIVLLRRVASALGIPLAELVSPDEVSARERVIRRFLNDVPAHRLEEAVQRLARDFGHDESVRRKRIALIGLRGAGKSTLGATLSRALKLPFVELDLEIEGEAGMSLAEIFNLYGQGGYRRIERRCLEKIIRRHERAVISVGGGIVSEAESYDLLLERCYTVWVKAAPEEHMSRVIAQGDLRPMAGNAEAMEDLRRILAAREPLYRKADLVIDTSGRKPEDSLAELRQSLLAEASA